MLFYVLGSIISSITFNRKAALVPAAISPRTASQVVKGKRELRAMGRVDQKRPVFAEGRRQFGSNVHAVVGNPALFHAVEYRQQQDGFVGCFAVGSMGPAQVRKFPEGCR